MKVKRVVPIIESGYVAPVSGFGDGGYGIAIQQTYDNIGVHTNYGEGNDIPEMELEIKSWDKSKKGHISVSSSTKDKIIATDGTVFLDKFKKWNLHIHESGVLKEVRKIEFEPIKNILKKELAELSQQLLNDSDAPKSEHLILEKVNSNSWKLRIKFHRAENLIGMTNSYKQLNNLFEFTT